MMRRSVWFAGHLTTVLMWGMAALLLNMSLGTSSFVSARTIIGCIFVACAGVSLLATPGKDFFWFIFGGIAIMTPIIKRNREINARSSFFQSAAHAARESTHRNFTGAAP